MYYNYWYISPFYPMLGTMQERLGLPFITVTQRLDNDAEITIEWDLIQNAQLYEIYVNGELVDSTNLNSIVYNAKQNGVYEIFIRALGFGYSSSRSNIVTIIVSSFGTFLVFGKKKILANMKKILIKA